jgi:hypothetical protein
MAQGGGGEAGDAHRGLSWVVRSVNQVGNEAMR